VSEPEPPFAAEIASRSEQLPGLHVPVPGSLAFVTWKTAAEAAPGKASTASTSASTDQTRRAAA
jgi:hypothetical protein